jgi:precorrin-8X/cobalt-precorrin-8 methylmutase
METGIIVLAHGSKIKSGTEGLHHIISMIQEMGNYQFVVPAFLQLSSPNLSEAIATLVDHQIERVVIMPLLLFSGNHVREDIPQAVESQKALYPEVTFKIARNIGPDPLIARIAYQRIEEVYHEPI